MQTEPLKPIVRSPFLEEVRHGVALWVARVTVFMMAAIFGLAGWELARWMLA